MALTLHILNVRIKVFNLTRLEATVEVTLDRQSVDFFCVYSSLFNSSLPTNLSFLSFILSLSNNLLQGIDVCTFPFLRVPILLDQCPSLILVVNSFDSEAFAGNLCVTFMVLIEILSVNRTICAQIKNCFGLLVDPEADVCILVSDVR